MSPKPVNYEYNPATISNNEHCRPNQSIMNRIELQYQTVNNVAQTIIMNIASCISFNQHCRPNQSHMNIIEPQFPTIITVAQTSQL